MCGIVGARHSWLLQSGLDPERAIQAAVERLRWRGPDGTGIVRIGDWWLGCARLAITQAGSRQPVVRRGGRLAGVMNGAITNARELWERLLPGAERRRAPPNDAWLPLLAVERGDRDALAHLRGHHAYAVVDEGTGELVFGQDRFGEKPLLCLFTSPTATGDLVAFGSSPLALQELGMPPLTADEAMPDLMRFGFADFQHTFDAGLALRSVTQRGVPLVAAATVGQRPWTGRAQEPWLPASFRSQLESQPESLRERFFASVARCIDTTQPTGLLLSGGIDSSCIAAGLRHAQHRAPAFQFQAHGTDPAERECARAVAAHCNLPFHPVDGGSEVLDALPHLTELAGIPLGDPSILAVFAVARAAAAQGVRILLGGEGADELFLGYRRYRALAALPRLRIPVALLPQWSMRYLARWLRAATAQDPAQALLEVTPPAFRRAIGTENREQAGHHQAPADRVLAAQQADLDGYLRLDLLPKVDIATMAAGIESRCPFLEGDLREFGATRAAMGKLPLRQFFANDLPAKVFRQPKRGFSLPLDRWFRGNCALLDLLAEPRTQQRAHLRKGAVAAVVDRHRRGHANLGHGLYLLAAMELFLRSQDR
jgi:asparagine synthase (glutamine-hydrolysing)